MKLEQLVPVRHTLSNGARLLAVGLPNTHRVVLAAQLMVGSRFEDRSDNGISHFLEHMLYRGTSAYPSAHELAVAFERHGGSLMASTSSDTGTLEVSMPPESIDAVLPLFAQVFQAPVFSAIDIERGIVREEILESLDDEGRAIGSDDLIRELAFAEHPLGQPISGTLSQLAGFSVSDLRRHHERFYCGSNAVFAAAGPINPKAAIEAMERAFSALPRGHTPTFEAPPSPARSRFRHVSHRASQTDVTLGFRAPGFLSADEPKMELIARMLDDGMATRLYHNLCDEGGLCYDVSGTYECYADSGLLELAAETEHGRVVEVVERLLGIVSELKSRPPTQEELDAAKRRYRWQLEAMLDSPFQVAEFFLTEELLGTRRSPLEREAGLVRVAPSDIEEAAQRWFATTHANLVLVGFPKKAALSKVLSLLQAFA